jgi:hypothetical protein
VGAWHHPIRGSVADVGLLTPRLVVRRLVHPTAGFALSILIINLAALVVLAITGEAIFHQIAAIVGLCDATVGVILLLRALGEGMRDSDPGRFLGDSAVALWLVTPLLLIWPDPIYVAGRLVSLADGQAIGEGFITIFVALSAIIFGVAIVSALRFDQPRST